MAELGVQDRLLTRLAGDAAVSGELSWLLTRLSTDSKGEPEFLWEVTQDSKHHFSKQSGNYLVYYDLTS